jgi:hypothetical protein
MVNIYELFLYSDKKRKKRNNRPKRGGRGWVLKKRGKRGKRGSFTTQDLLDIDYSIF